MHAYERKILAPAVIALAALFASVLWVTPVAVAEPAAEEARNDKQPSVARGAKAWAEHCGRCHNYRSPDELRDNEWEVSVTHMRLVANLPGDMARDILAFLQASN